MIALQSTHDLGPLAVAVGHHGPFRTEVRDPPPEIRDSRAAGDDMTVAADPYPLWSYFPLNRRSPAWCTDFLAAVRKHESTISTASKKTELSSDPVLQQVREDLTAQGFIVERSKKTDDRIRRPVLFGRNGEEAVAYEIDAFHDKHGIAVEVEAGRGAQNNGDYRDLIRASLILDAKYLALLMPQAYRFNSNGKEQKVSAYGNSWNLLDAIYKSQRLALPFEGILLVGY
jgi:hypothetical protein